MKALLLLLSLAVSAHAQTLPAEIADTPTMENLEYLNQEVRKNACSNGCSINGTVKILGSGNGITFPDDTKQTTAYPGAATAPAVAIASTAVSQNSITSSGEPVIGSTLTVTVAENSRILFNIYADVDGTQNIMYFTVFRDGVTVSGNARDMICMRDHGTGIASCSKSIMSAPWSAGTYTFYVQVSAAAAGTNINSDQSPFEFNVLEIQQ